MSLVFRYPLKTLNNRRVAPWVASRNGKNSEAGVMETTAAMERLRSAQGGFLYGKIGTTELLALEFSERYLQPSWPAGLSWKRQADRLLLDSGVFPATRGQFDRFLHTYAESVGALDGICLWQDSAFLRQYELRLASFLCPNASHLSGQVLSPFSVLPEIANLRWLVVSPFVKTMKSQERHLARVHSFYPWHGCLEGIEGRPVYLRCPFFSYMEKSPYRDWSEGVDRLTEEALKHEFDLALVGAGAWSLPLLANLKRAGKKGIHLGGATQLVFGIKGRRWDQEGWYMPYNEAWVRPLPEETPAGYMQKERGCYW